MDIRELKYFVTIAQLQSYTKAAQKLFISQPALSKTMRSLEGQLGLPLFDRESKGVVLTKSGEALLEQALPLLMQFDNITTIMENLRDWGKGAVVIGSSPLVSTLFLSNIMLDFKAQYPDIYLDVQEKGHLTSCAAVVDGQNDVAVVCDCDFSPQLASEPVYYDEMAAVFLQENPLGEREYLTFEDVREQNFFFYSNNYYTHHVITQRCHQAGYVPRIGCTHAQSKFLLNVLQGDHDMAILPMPFLRQNDNANFRIVPFRPHLPWNLCLVYNRNRQLSFAVSEFISFARRKFIEYRRESPFQIPQPEEAPTPITE